MLDFILEIACDASNEELIQSRLFLTASTGNTTSGDTISAYFDSAEDRDSAMDLLRELDVRAVERERVDWLDRYQQSLEPIVIGERFLVAPDASLIPQDTDRFTIVVPQEQAFGTGSHETTSLCIELLESLGRRTSSSATGADREVRPPTLRGKRGLDIGSGSGILAIAMLRLGAEKVIAFDNDVDAYGALRDNRLRNGIDPARMPIFIGSIEALRGGTFDVITMNIVPEVIVPMLDDVMRHASGAVILSGVLAARRDEIPLACRLEKTKGEWWAGVITRLIAADIDNSNRRPNPT
ncbi:MAG TPA: 50S ribosomal protein L11 methyltransferase [Thermoanaerobaculia bacterium]|nr:50S ribosomal protein L11 methyltransferase [Thermoanaerobaculia bacterium]